MPVLPIEALERRFHDFEAGNLADLALDDLPIEGGVIVVGRHRTGQTEVRLVDRAGSIRRRVHELRRERGAIMAGEEGSNFLGYHVEAHPKRREAIYLEVKLHHDPAAMREGRAPRVSRGLSARPERAFPSG